jgi:uncharacterized membrane protein
MEPASSETKGGQPRGLGPIALAILGLCLFILSVDRMIDAWGTGQTWRVALYAVVALVAMVAAVYSALRGWGA